MAVGTHRDNGRGGVLSVKQFPTEDRLIKETVLDWKKEHPRRGFIVGHIVGVDFSEQDLSQLRMSYGTFTACNFEKANLSDTFLWGITFINCNLAGVNWSGASLRWGCRKANCVESYAQITTADNERYSQEGGRWVPIKKAE